MPGRPFLLLGAVVLLGGCHHRPDQAGFVRLSDRPGEPVVQLWCDEIPHLEAIACHCWFAAWAPEEGRWRRWEVWQHAGRRAGRDWGHVRRDLMGAGAGVSAEDDGSPPWVLGEWRGAEAAALQEVLRRPQDYPWREQYRYWPGPNSNTYAAWVLGEANIRHALPPAAIGAGYAAWR